MEEVPNWGSNWREFLERREEALPELSPVDASALRFVRAWHMHPDLASALHVGDLDLGDIVEFILLQEVIPIFASEHENPA